MTSQPASGDEDDDAEELVSEDAADYDEKIDLEDSDLDSDSDFEASNDSADEDYASDDAPATRRSPRKSSVTDFVQLDEDSDIEAQMMQEAIQLSMLSVVDEDRLGSGAGASSSSASALRAVAAECRLELSKQGLAGGYIIDSDAELANASDDEPLSKKGKGKGKGKAKGGSIKNSKRNKAAEDEDRQDHVHKWSEKRTLRAEQQALRKKLGRKLTYAERTTLALHRYHPELHDVWGSLERNVKPVVPEKAQQPEELKIDLLPFQLESLYWMRKQEESEWAGGMLAVSTTSNYPMILTKNILLLCAFVSRMKWGKPHSVGNRSLG